MSCTKIYANIYDEGRRCFRHGSMEYESGRITDVSFDDGAGGDYIIPGLVDVHTHGRGGIDFQDVKAPDEVERLLELYARNGVTSVMATIATAEYDALKTAIGCAVAGGAAGVHLEGCYLNPARKGAHNEALLRKLDVDEIHELIELMKPLPAHITTAPELEHGREFVQECIRLGATVALGHSDATCEQAMEALSLGVCSFTHTLNAMRSFHHREVGSVGAAWLSDAYCELICDGFHLAPEAVRITYRLKGADRVILITDSMGATGLPDGEYSIAGSRAIMKDGKVRTPEGAIAGSTLNLLDGVHNFAEFCGIPFEEALRCATSIPARAYGIADVGTLEAGKNADFAVLDKDLRTIKRVVRRGEDISL